MRAYPSPPPKGQWEWAKDADQAMKYHEWITTGWPKYGGMAFLAANPPKKQVPVHPADPP